jgi:DNA-binding NtrC family response regulator
VRHLQTSRVPEGAWTGGRQWRETLDKTRFTPVTSALASRTRLGVDGSRGGEPTARCRRSMRETGAVMPTLLVKEGPRRGAVIEVRGEEFAVGGEAGNGQWVASATGQGSQAILSRAQDGWYLLRGPGVIGTWLNEHLIERARLRHLDEIRIGDSRLVFLDDETDEGLILIQRFRNVGRRTHVRHLHDQAETHSPQGSLPTPVQLPLGVVLDAYDVKDPADAVACVLNGAVSAACQALSADEAMAVLLDGSELRPILTGRHDPEVTLDTLSVNTHLLHASLMGGYAATWVDCEPQPYVACAPVRPDAGTKAVIYVGRGRLKGEFCQGDLASLVSLAGQAAAAVQHLAESRRVSRRLRSLERQVLERYDMLGNSPAMRAVYSFIEKVAPTDTGVLICGETGTGKELVARAIHARSRRHDGPLEIVNCAAVPRGLLESELFGHVRGAFTGADSDHPGLFELADEGTLVLDEVTEMPLDCQSRLLRVLEDARVRRVGATHDHVVDVRVLAVTNRDPMEAVAEGRLRRDVFYRLDRLRVLLPPLRERGEDIGLLARHFVRAFAARNGTSVEVSDEALDVLRSYGWPGNVRELRNMMERAVLLCDGPTLTAQSFPETITSEAGLRGYGGFQTLSEVEQAHIERALVRAHGNKSLAARLLGIDRTTLYARTKRSGAGQEHDTAGPADQTAPPDSTRR